MKSEEIPDRTRLAPAVARVRSRPHPDIDPEGIKAARARIGKALGALACPLLCRLHTDTRVIAVAGSDDGLPRQREQLSSDRGEKGLQVGVGPPGRPRSTLEQGVAGEDGGQVCSVQTHP